MSKTEPTWDQDLNTWTATNNTGTTYYFRTGQGTGTADSQITWGQWVPQISGAQEDPPSEDAGTDDSESEGDDADTTEGDDSDEEKQFTQADLNRLLAKEVDKAKRGKLDPKELGFDSRKDLEAFVKAMKEKSEEEKSEAERQMETAINEAKESATKDVLAKSKQLVLKAEFKLQAQANGVSAEARDDAFVIAQTLEDWQNVEVSDDGDVSGLDEDFFETLKKDKPYLFAQPSNDDEEETPNIGQRAGGRRGKDTANDKELKAKYPALQGSNWRW